MDNTFFKSWIEHPRANERAAVDKTVHTAVGILTRLIGIQLHFNGASNGMVSTQGTAGLKRRCRLL